MPTPTQPLRDEHRNLFPHVEQLRRAADAIGETLTEANLQGIDDAWRFLSGHLIPHATAEDAALYPVVARLMGAPEATATMRRDHVEVDRLTSELGALRERLAAGARDPALARDARRVLYGLYALIAVHFAKEEEIYLPLLDARLTMHEATAMVRDMESAARAASVTTHGAHAD